VSGDDFSDKLPEFISELDDFGDYAAFIIGGSLGAAVDVLFLGVSAGGCSVGGAVGLVTLKKSMGRINGKKKLRHRCEQHAELYEKRDDKKKAKDYRDLIQKIDYISSLSQKEIRREMRRLEKKHRK